MSSNLQSSDLSAERAVLDPDASRLRLQTTIRLRWFAVTGQIVAVLLVYFGLGFDLPMGWCLLLIAASVWLNVFLKVWYPTGHRLAAPFATLLLIYDIGQLSALLYLTGGIDNPFTVLLAAPVIVAAATLPPRPILLLGGVALVMTACLSRFHQPLPWYPGAGLDLPMLYKLGTFCGVAASCIVFLGFYGWRLSKESRQMSAALAATELVLAREQKLHALDGLAAAAAHELGTPLGTIVLVAKELEREAPADSPHLDDLALLKSQAQRCREILQTLTRRPTESDPLHATLSVTQLIEEAVERHRVAGVSVRTDCGPYVGGETGGGEPVGERRPGVIYGVGNLIENAIEFARKEVVVTARWNEREVMITVTDDGPGIPPDVMDTLGEPYVTTRRSTGTRQDEGKTTGLGLGFFIAKTLLERSGANLALSNRPGPATGALVTLTWRRAAFERQEAIWSAFPGRSRIQTPPAPRSAPGPEA